MVKGDTPARRASSALLIIAACRSLRTLLGSTPERAFDFDFEFPARFGFARDPESGPGSDRGVSEDDARVSAEGPPSLTAFGSAEEFEVMALTA